MIQKLPLCLIVVLFSHLQVVISKGDLHARTSLNISPNGSTFLWLPQDEYSGPSFFECVYFLFRGVKHLRITWKATGTFSRETTQHSEKISALLIWDADIS